MRHSRTLLLLGLTTASAAALADSTTIVTGSLGGTSDFVFRGLSLTRGKPAAQGSIDVEFPKEFYVGAFTATCDPNPGPSPPLEIDVWAGRYWRMGQNFSGDLRVSQYSYVDDPRRKSYDRTEFTGTVGFRNAVFLAASYSPKVAAVASSPGYEEGHTWVFELSGKHALNDRFSVSAGFGHYGLEYVYHDSYNYWNVTLTATLAPFELQLAYLGVDDRAARHFPSDVVGDRVALTALWRFSNQ